jgi:Putative peptidoglycan binding domain
VPRRSKTKRRLTARAAGIAGSIGFWLWARVVRRPLDATAALAAVVGCVAILVNALFLQSGSHPSRYVANPVPVPLPIPAPAKAKAAAESRRSASGASAATGAAEPTRSWQPVVDRRGDPIGELIESSSRVMMVQRVLSNYGYGQISPSGILDKPTQAAIERFERDRNLPVTGAISDRLVSALSAMVGRRLE